VILEIPAVTRNSRVLRSGNPTSGQPYLRGGGGRKTVIHLNVHVVLLRVHSQWGLERTKPTPWEGKRPEWSVVRGFSPKIFPGYLRNSP
jgi:hypothetical protein